LDEIDRHWRDARERESVNKHLRTWQRQGCVRIADRLIVITNRAGLEDLTVPEG
jgi:hypothetical protein